ncbi:MAG TPA: glycosyltransferase family 2 protein [Vicinamibacterales bacterium]|nr:glycosyltransferase family 2 protein [Vicinamibacterales bacterium]
MPPLSSLSVLVPIYNERATIERLLNAVVAVNTRLTVEVLACDDGSTDGTRDILSRLSLPGLKVIFMDQNVGRGGVIKHLWSHATGDIIVHQDADLEYDPQDYIPMLEPLLAGRADVVYGSRFKGSIEGMRFLNRVGNLLMTASARSLYGVKVSDLMTCYKMYRSALIRDLHIDANGFDFEAEFTARLAQRGARFAEVPVRFSGRTFEEGKKIRAFDAVRVMRELIRCKLSGEPRASESRV